MTKAPSLCARCKKTISAVEAIECQGLCPRCDLVVSVEAVRGAMSAHREPLIVPAVPCRRFHWSAPLMETLAFVMVFWTLMAIGVVLFS